MAMPVAGYKPSPLGYGSPRSSPFRRPESPSSSPIAYRRGSTPNTSPTKVGPLQTPAIFANLSTPENKSEARTLRRYEQPDDTTSPQHLGSPVRMSSRATPPPPSQPSAAAAAVAAGHGNALSQLQVGQVRVLRDGFQILDRDSDGVVNREDVADMLTQLGLPAGPSDVSQFFPPAGAQTMTLAVFLNSIATTLASMSPSAELLSAFSAFDDDDSGQVDLGELRDALLRTAPEPGERALTAAEVDKIVSGFSGRRAFSKSSMAGGVGKRGEVFRYQDFVNSIVGGNGSSEPSSNEITES